MSDWEWFRNDWLETGGQILLFVILFLGGPWIVEWLLKDEDEQWKKRVPQPSTRRSRRSAKKQTSNGRSKVRISKKPSTGCIS
jgi:hypothetical protein